MIFNRKGVAKGGGVKITIYLILFGENKSSLVTDSLVKKCVLSSTLTNLCLPYMAIVINAHRGSYHEQLTNYWNE